MIPPSNRPALQKGGRVLLTLKVYISLAAGSLPDRRRTVACLTACLTALTARPPRAILPP